MDKEVEYTIGIGTFAREPEWDFCANATVASWQRLKKHLRVGATF